MVPTVLTGDWVYGAVALVSGAWFVRMALRLKTMPNGKEMDQ